MLSSSKTTTPTTTTTAAATTTTMIKRTRIGEMSTISSDPGILCFHHCNVKVFCFTLPHICPNCKSELDTTGTGSGSGCESGGNGDDSGYSGRAYMPSKLLPFRLPYPFVRAAQYPCAIVLRPTTGDFLNDYNNATDLHIAVTASNGCVVEFDRHGLRRHRADNMADWWQCLLVGDVPEPWHDYWDQVLLQTCRQPSRWSVAHYREDSHNCYTFVLAFLQALGYEKLSVAAKSKTVFCEKYIVPRTTTAGKYISLYRKLRDAGVYVHPHHSRHHHHNHHHHQEQQQQHQQQEQRQPVHRRHNHHHQQQQSARHLAKVRSAIGHSPAPSSTNSIMSRPSKLCTIEE